MKAIKPVEPGQVDCVGLEKPVPGPGQTLIRIKTTGIYGNDIDTFRGTNRLISHPRIIRHELAGITEEILADNPKGLKVEGRVVVGPYLYCGTCYPCGIGRISCCTSLKVLSIHINGGMAEYYYHPADMLVRTPGDIDWAGATMAEPLTISLHGVHRDGLKAGEYCAIIGAGPIELLAGMIIQVYGAHAILLDLVQEHLDLARELGIEYVINSREGNPVGRVSEITSGTATQQVMECSGANVAVLQTLDLVGHTGRITLTGWPPKETPTPTDIIARKEIDIHGAHASAGKFEEAVELVYAKEVGMAKILTETTGLEEAPETIRGIEKNPGNYVKVVIKVN